MFKPQPVLFKLITVSLFIIVCQKSLLYSQGNLKGKVIDDNQEALAYANVLLLNSIDSSLIRGELTDDGGNYIFQAVDQGSYLISSSYLGYSDYYSEVINISNNQDLRMDDIILSEGVSLDEVQVVAKKALFEQKIDRLVVNVASSLTSAGGTALEVLEKSPGVIVNRQSNNISLVGKDGLSVMINGKLTYQPVESIIQMLEGMPSDNIESIEIITTPPANFDAEGNAGFINIILKERTDMGLNGNWSASVGYGRGETASANLGLNYRKDKLNIFSNYSYTRMAQEQFFYNYRKVDFENTITESEVSTNREPNENNHNIRLGLDYELSDNTIVGLLFGAYNNRWAMDANNFGMTTINNTLDSRLSLVNDEVNEWKHFMSNINIEQKIGSSGKLNLNLDYLLYEDDNPTNYTTEFFDADDVLLKLEETRSRKLTPINIKVAQVDYSNTINENINFLTGFKIASSEFTNDVSVEIKENNEWNFIDQFTNESDLKENILAAFASVDFKIKDNNTFKAGLRYEHTDSKLNTIKEGSVVDRQFGALFPSVFYSRKINDEQSLNLSYSRRITRPTFNDMAPFAIFLDPNTFFFGNASLQPAIANNYKVDYRLNSYMLSVQYSKEDSTISRFQDRVTLNTNQQAYEPVNLSNTENISANLSVPVYIGNNWTMQNNFLFLWSQTESYYDDDLIKLSNKSYNISTTQTWLLENDFSLELNAFYNSPSISGRST
ncbi:MAG: TonB-dependent receptor, partial [Saprospiraceae bacterium]|nr:TonB-dependent receptor [Saprospiraceae bacterium]